jgi:AcrR family transcriptional regulator
MADMRDNAPPTRRRRSDARRSIDAVLTAARTVLGERPDASMEDIATAAGVTRQTVYAHFPSRDALIAALIEDARVHGLAALDAAGLDTAPPAEALGTFLDISWQLVLQHPVLLDPTLNRAPRLDGSDPHLAVTARLEHLIRRGQDTGDFDDTLPVCWLAAAVLELGHAAAEQVADGRFTPGDATRVLLESALRLCGAAGSGTARPSNSRR